MIDITTEAAAHGLSELPIYHTGDLLASLMITAPEIQSKYKVSKAHAYRLLHCVPRSRMAIIDDGRRRLLAAPRREVESFRHILRRGCPLMRDSTYQQIMARRRWEKWKGEAAAAPPFDPDQ